ncbi:copper amine oxidase N-terminal domain-containing protein [Paenibacillus sp. DCT19]|uniref:copper amine oxidase N-terminal domain-containing protein n=1 Tax=Paenibacillus sp. DCT19 TaxID=2211212 RepID=UPI000FE1EAE8|nr:copper amine oxidase N-terminal domain-containing protein [Paenibacillus sp. DCT19]
MNVQLSGFGVSNAIIFRLDGVEDYTGKYQVNISGLRTVGGQATELSYTVDFYDLSQHFYPGETEKWNLQFSVEKGWSYETRTGTKYFDEENRPYIEKGSTLVPLRLVSESLGLDVEWDPADRVIRISDDKKEIVLKTGSQQVRVNGVETTVSVAPKVVRGVTFVPLRFVSEQLGLSVDFEESSKLVRIEREYVH